MGKTKKGSLIFKLTVLVAIFLGLTVTFYTYKMHAGFNLLIAENDHSKMVKIMEKNLNHGMLLGVGFTFIAVVLFHLLLRHFLNPMIEMKKKFNTLAENGGDLTQQIEIKNRDEIGELAEAFNKFIANTKIIIADVKKAAENTALIASQIELAANQTGKVSEEIAVATNEVATGAVSQTEAAEEIVHMMEKNKEEVMNGLEEAERTLNNAESSTKIAYTGRNAIGEAINHLSSVTRTVEFATDSIQKLGKRSGEIGNIVTMISNIANQTNLLALNASIEAARAGEAGKGFVVVAEEVRKLAEESENAAKSITGLIKDIQAETSVTVRTMESNLEKVNIQVDIIKKGGEALTQIVDKVEETEKDTKDIYEIFGHIQNITDKVFEDMEQISSIIEETSASAEEVAAATEEQSSSTEEMASQCTELTSMANRLKDEAHKFKTE
ncbi:methyl-accepting chemotaxis protein [Crassaminicella profunda]|uniref:methyl-accepting chemotaxis protein n=1 Tax=Crassaminicella profunda TaxID=1286698 RepID=UPI001CA671B5|nr:HAMP domain-containing methyl-accepting chemotaxis protein [Crassaminicella profunda]QZY54683.1 methyl-accepting chemotaxis protein [Crassaminicella profunda]